ncbi:MAG: DUF4160 domain-containing protein [Stomatobaculum sp.]|nr:DUF4160 domain-containing protein [Stomatobaculum sp.]
MPVLSMFFGIIIRMYNESGERHKIPHIHCVYSEYEATVDFYGNVLEGELPQSKMKLVAAWIELHREELYANWELLNHGEKHFRINPLQ